MKRCLILPALALLSGCGSPNDPGEGGVTKREAQELNAVAERLDSQEPAPSLANTQIPAVPAPPADPEFDSEANEFN